MIYDDIQKEYKSIKEVDSRELYDSLINLNHDIRDIKKGLYYARKIKRTQLKYRVFKRKKHYFSELSNMMTKEYSKAYSRLSSAVTPNGEDRAHNDIEILAYELALVNDISRPYEYNPELDNCIKIYKSDIKKLKKQKRELIMSALNTQLSNMSAIKEIDTLDGDIPVSKYKSRVLRRFLR